MEFIPAPILASTVKLGQSQEPSPLYYHLAAVQFSSLRISLLLPSSPPQPLHTLSLEVALG